MSFRHRTVVPCLYLACSLVTPFAAAQQGIITGAVAGRVTDSSGAVLPGSEVTATESGTGRAFSTLTDDAGRFTLGFLSVGAYRLSVTHAGFGAQSRTVAVGPGSAFNLAIQLGVATAVQSVDVRLSTPEIETARTQIAETVTERETVALPFLGRNYLDLALLLPGVSVTNTGSTQALAETSEVPGQGYSVNSQRNFSNSFVVDGLSANDDAAGTAGNVFSLDAVRQFSVVTSGGQAEFGRALGGYFNVITRSGSNDVHGTAYGFLRNQRMSAANALTRTQLPITQGQYGASLSGPLRRNRTFLFGNFEEGRLRSSGVITLAPATATTINNRLVAVGYAAPLLPVASTGSTVAFPTTLHTDTVFLRADHHISAADQISVRYSFYQLSSRNARGTGALNQVSNGTSVFDSNHTVAAGNLFTLSPRAVLETRAQFVVDHLDAPPNTLNGPAVTISGVAVFGRSTSSPTARYDTSGELANNLVLYRGPHTFKAGADLLVHSDTITFPMSLRGSYSFSSLANFLAGTYNSQGFTENFGTPTVTQLNPNLGFYAQDEWRPTPSLTVNLGLRYDLQFLRTLRTDSNNLSPRIGLAWSPFADRRTVVRSNFGLFYDRLPLRPLANALLSAGNTSDPAQATLLSYTFSPGGVGAPVFPAVAAAPPAGALINYTLMDRDIANPYSLQASLGVEQQIARDLTLGVSYQHLRGVHLVGSINGNINADGTRPDTTRGNVRSYRSAFDSTFDGLEVSLLKRPSAWSSARISYTWSRAIDNVGEFFFSVPLNNFNLREDRARSDDDQRHRVSANTVLTSHFAHGRTTGALLNGWELGGTLAYTSRLPFNVVTGATTRQGTNQRPCAPGFTLTANAGNNPCTQGLAGAVIGRNTGIGFDAWTLNTRLSRTLALGERVRVLPMVEAFNLLNHRNNQLPNAIFGTGVYPSTPLASFNTPAAVADPRAIQLALRITF